MQKRPDAFAGPGEETMQMKTVTPEEAAKMLKALEAESREAKGKEAMTKMKSGAVNWFTSIRAGVSLMAESASNRLNGLKESFASRAYRGLGGTIETVEAVEKKAVAAKKAVVDHKDAVVAGVGFAAKGAKDAYVEVSQAVDRAEKRVQDWEDNEALNMDKSVVWQGTKRAAEFAAFPFVVAAIAGHRGGKYLEGKGRDAIAAGQELYGAGKNKAQEVYDDASNGVKELRRGVSLAQAEASAKVQEAQNKLNAAMNVARAVKSGLGEAFQASYGEEQRRQQEQRTAKQNEQQAQMDTSWVNYFVKDAQKTPAERAAERKAMSPEDFARVNLAYTHYFSRVCEAQNAILRQAAHASAEAAVNAPGGSDTKKPAARRSAETMVSGGMA